MLRDRTSKFVFYSLGIVTEDKARGSDTIKVSPIEEFNFTDGLLSAATVKQNVSLPDAKGTMTSSNVTSTVVITADWIPFGESNRMTAPDVIKNETVMIFRYADTDEYHWTTIFREPGIRRQETVTYMFGNIKDPLKAFDKESSYWFEVSTHDKYVHLHTAKNDGEPFAYDIILDTKNGTVELTDDIQNFIKLDSKESDITVETNKTINLNATSKVTVNTTDCEVNASNTCVVNTTTATVNASDSLNVNSPESNFSGNVTIQDNLKVVKTISGTGGIAVTDPSNLSGTGGAASFEGTIKVTGDVDATNNISAGGDITAGGTVHGTNI